MAQFAWPWSFGPEFIDPQKFGVTVALNRRLIADVFELEEPALAWLGSHAPPFHACTIGGGVARITLHPTKLALLTAARSCPNCASTEKHNATAETLQIIARSKHRQN